MSTPTLQNIPIEPSFALILYLPFSLYQLTPHRYYFSKDNVNFFLKNTSLIAQSKKKA